MEVSVSSFSDHSAVSTREESVAGISYVNKSTKGEMNEKQIKELDKSKVTSWKAANEVIHEQ